MNRFRNKDVRRSVGTERDLVYYTDTVVMALLYLHRFGHLTKMNDQRMLEGC